MFVEAAFEAALIETSPPFAFTIAFGAIVAVVLIVMIPIETEPATPIVPPPAPETVSVSNVLTASEPFTVSSAESTTPCELTVRRAVDRGECSSR